MKNLKITTSCLVKGNHTEAGTILKNVDNAIAADLLVSGRAVEIAADAVVSRDPDPETRDPKPAKQKEK